MISESEIDSFLLDLGKRTEYLLALHSDHYGFCRWNFLPTGDSAELRDFVHGEILLKFFGRVRKRLVEEIDPSDLSDSPICRLIFSREDSLFTSLLWIELGSFMHASLVIRVDRYKKDFRPSSSLGKIRSDFYSFFKAIEVSDVGAVLHDDGMADFWGAVTRIEGMLDRFSKEKLVLLVGARGEHLVRAKSVRNAVMAWTILRIKVLAELFLNEPLPTWVTYDLYLTLEERFSFNGEGRPLSVGGFEGIFKQDRFDTRKAQKIAIRDFQEISKGFQSTLSELEKPNLKQFFVGKPLARNFIQNVGL